MNTENIYVNTQSSIRMQLDKTLYFDPYKISDDKVIIIQDGSRKLRATPMTPEQQKEFDIWKRNMI